MEEKSWVARELKALEDARVVVARDSEEWHWMWRQVAKVYDLEYLDHEWRQEWQYTGTYSKVHEFRHRSYHGERVIYRVAASSRLAQSLCPARATATDGRQAVN